MAVIPNLCLLPHKISKSSLLRLTKQIIKRLLLPKGGAIREIRFGIGRGLRMQLDLQTQLQRVFGLDERELTGFLEELIPCCKSLVDVGANDGYYSLIFLKSDAQVVVACEPSDVVDRLVTNAAANGYHAGPRLKIERRSVGLGAGNVTLHELLWGLPRPVLVKMDIEGAELLALQSMGAGTHMDRLLWIIETHSVELETACLSWLRNRSYSPVVVDHAWWRRLLPEHRPDSHNRWIVAVPDNFEAAQDRRTGLVRVS